MRGTGSHGGFWNLLTPTERDALYAAGRTTVLPPKTTMCVEGEPATHLFVLLDGWVKVVSVTRDGQEVMLALRGPGEIIGELAGEATGFRTGTVRSIDTVHSLIIPHEAFSAFLDAHPNADRAYRKMVTIRWYESATALIDRSTIDGTQRLARLLIDLAARHGAARGGAVNIEMPITQGELASLAGVSRATMTRALNEWRRRRIIQTGKGHITITNMDGLRKIAAG
jgi:CRP/FNR family transcriptional regulator, cyclic AMP receptor protein